MAYRQRFDTTYCFCFVEFSELLKKKRRATDENDLNQLAITCRSLGEYYHERADYQKALKNFEDEAAAHKSNGSSSMDLGKSHRMIGEMHMLLGDFEKAFKHELSYLGMFSVSLLEDMTFKSSNLRMVKKASKCDRRTTSIRYNW